MDVLRHLVSILITAVSTTLIVAATALVTLTVAATIELFTAVAPTTTAPGQAAAISPEEIQRQTDVNGLPVTIVDQPC
jgi:hypothetical protein